MPSLHGSPSRRLAVEQVVGDVLRLADAALLPEAVAEDPEAPGRGSRRSSSADSSRAASQMWAARRRVVAEEELAPGQALQGDPAAAGRWTSSSSWARSSLGSAAPRAPGDQLGPPVGAHRPGLPGEVTGAPARPGGPSSNVRGRAVDVAQEPGDDAEPGVGLAQVGGSAPGAPPPPLEAPRRPRGAAAGR